MNTGIETYSLVTPTFVVEFSVEAYVSVVRTCLGVDDENDGI